MLICRFLCFNLIVIFIIKEKVTFTIDFDKKLKVEQSIAIMNTIFNNSFDKFFYYICFNLRIIIKNTINVLTKIDYKLFIVNTLSTSKLKKFEKRQFYDVIMLD